MPANSVDRLNCRMARDVADAAILSEVFSYEMRGMRRGRIDARKMHDLAGVVRVAETLAALQTAIETSLQIASGHAGEVTPTLARDDATQLSAELPDAFYDLPVYFFPGDFLPRDGIDHDSSALASEPALTLEDCLVRVPRLFQTLGGAQPRSAPTHYCDSRISGGGPQYGWISNRTTTSGCHRRGFLSYAFLE